MFKLTDSQQVQLNLKGVSAAGNDAPLENVVVTSSDESIVTVSGSHDVGFTLTAIGVPGTSQIAVTADARIGEGEVVLSGMETIEVVAGEAVLLNLQFGEPSQKA